MKNKVARLLSQQAWSAITEITSSTTPSEMNCGTTSMIASINKIGNFEEVRDHMSRGKVIPYIIMFKIEDEEDNNVNEFTDKEELEDFETDRNE